MLGFNVIAADTDEAAHVLATSPQQAFVNLRSGRPSRLPPPRPGYYESLPPPFRAVLDDVLQCSAIGAVGVVREKLGAFAARTRADEIMVTSMIFDHGARLRSLEITASVTIPAPSGPP